MWWVQGDIISVWFESPQGSSFFNNFKNLTLARVFSWKILCKPIRRTTFSFKLESYSRNIFRKNCYKLDFLCIFKTTNYENHVWRTKFSLRYSYKKCNQLLHLNISTGKKSSYVWRKLLRNGQSCLAGS